jgi:hypothetical protein
MEVKANMDLCFTFISEWLIDRIDHVVLILFFISRSLCKECKPSTVATLSSFLFANSVYFVYANVVI